MIFTLWNVIDVRALRFQTHRHCLALFTSFCIMSRVYELGIAEFPAIGKARR